MAVVYYFILPAFNMELNSGQCVDFLQTVECMKFSTVNASIIQQKISTSTWPSRSQSHCTETRALEKLLQETGRQPEMKERKLEGRGQFWVIWSLECRRPQQISVRTWQYNSRSETRNVDGERRNWIPLSLQCQSDSNKIW